MEFNEAEPVAFRKEPGNGASKGFVQMNFSRKPNTFSLYLKGIFARHQGLRPGEKLPAMKAHWRDFRIDPVHLKKVSALCSLYPGKTMPLIYPLTVLFPLHMSTIARGEFPLLYLRMLHVRDHLLQHRPVDVGEKMEISCMITGQRVIPKGSEFDIHSIMSSSGEPVWEGISTNFFPGSFGEPGQSSPLAQFDPMPDQCSTVRWMMPEGKGFRFGLLTGDYNGIHYLAPYARMLGFKRDFMHAQRSLAECLRALPPVEGDNPMRLDVAFKGPVYYGTSALMKYTAIKGGFRFDLHTDDDERPCVTGNVFKPQNGVNLTKSPA
ncbi:MAG: hypothetical protein ABSA71_07920 [Desulfomonilia bacterium]|jgi:hypothetical protein